MPLTPVFEFSGRTLIPKYPQNVRRRSIALPPSVSYPRGAILGELVGVSQQYTVTLGSQASGNFTLTVGGNTTGNIAYNAAASAVQAALLALASLAQAAVHTLTMSGTPTGGTFTLSYGGQTTTPLAYNATAAQVQAALQALSSIGPSNVTVSGGPFPGSAMTITFAGELAGVPQPYPIEADSTKLQGGTAPAVTDVVVNPGGGPATAANVAVTGSAGGPYTVTFQGGEADEPVTMTAAFGGLATPGNASLAVAAAGIAGTHGTFKAYAAGNTDGSQTPRLILEHDCQTDASGLIYWGQGGAAPVIGVGLGRQTTPAFVSGAFACEELSGLDANCVNPGVSGWRLVSGTLEQGELLLP